MDKIDFGQNQYCGPSVVAALTGLNTDEAAALFTQVTKRKVITSVTVEEMEKVLLLAGLESRETFLIRNASLYTFIHSRIDYAGKYLVYLDKHVVLVEITPERKVNILDNHTREPLSLSSSSRLSDTVIHARKVHTQNQKSAESIRQEQILSKAVARLVKPAIKSLIIKKTCPKCGKDVVEVSRTEFLGSKIIKLRCGHSVNESTLDSSEDAYHFKAVNGNTLMPFQVKGVEFAEKSNVRCLIGDEQGLGKTVQALATLRLHRDDLFPVIGVVKTTLKHQWFHMIRNWVGQGLLIQILNSGKDIPLPGFDVYLISYDLLDSKDFFAETEFKTLIFDECQMIKNHLAARSKASQKLANEATHIIALSGTAIKNNAGEYFTILNILQPGRFPEYQAYLRNHCDVSGQKIGGLKKPEAFHELTKDFIIRRTKEEVFPELPQTQRNFHHVELDPRFNKAYAEALKELDDLMYSDEGESESANMHILAIMTKMRRITGLSKTLECADFVGDFLDSCDRKILIFCHHHDVVEILLRKTNDELRNRGMKELLNLTSDVKGFAREAMIKEFQRTDGPRVMIASTLSAGEGLDGLQLVCSDMIILERQWNPANEEQVEGRIDRRIGQKNKVNITYMIASETIDDYFTEIVEIKRSIVGSTLDGKEIAWNQSSLLKELAQALITKGGKRWSVKSLTSGQPIQKVVSR